MKKLTKKMLSLMLACLMLCTVFTPAASAERVGGAVPTIYVVGQGATLRSATGEIIYDFTVEDGYILNAVKECLPSFIEAFVKDDWDAYTELLVSVVAPVFENIQLDKNGEASNGSHVAWSWSPATLGNRIQNGVYPIGAYTFNYDWRLDPFEIAQTLHAYVEDVKRWTGSDEVNLIGRCEGGNVLMAYLADYGSEGINCMQFYCHAVGGVDVASSVFSGKARADAQAVNRYIDGKVELDDPLLNELLLALIELAQGTAGMNVACWTVNQILEKVIENCLVDVLMCTYGTFPGVWSFVSPADYADAREVVFAGREREYAGMLEKLDDYDVRVRQRINDLLLAARDDGVKIAVIAKYGKQNIPFAENNNTQADGTCSLYGSSFGATVAPFGETLPADYLDFVRQHRLEKYVSADLVVDASTALFPDTTWILRDIEHRIFPPRMDELMRRFLYSDGEMTVFDDPDFPQFMVFDEETQTFAPLTDENAFPPAPDGEPKSVFDLFRRFFKALIAFLENFFANRKAQEEVPAA